MQCQEPTPVSGQRRTQAYAKMAAEEAPRATAYAPAQEIEEPESRVAQIKQNEVKTHGGTPGCPGCKAIITGKGRNHHSLECRRRFEQLLQKDAKSKLRFDRAAERRLQGITKRAMAMDPDAAAASSNAAGASGSGATVEQKQTEIAAQNAKDLAAGTTTPTTMQSERREDQRCKCRTAATPRRLSR